VCRCEKNVGIGWVVELAGRALIWLGDLSRYSLDLAAHQEERIWRTALARKYYSLSTRLLPGLGLPYNQLAALATHSTLDQVAPSSEN
jgi:hypothetical protein